ncbi:hypothetical protein SAMN05421869_15826 [Nonomuraea jiangxiensis]|uniref:Uncharacterized protein n=2 Tax=Nonomuraea jiangxiensis TaxID=633440 RepID=A0A1G9WEA3_9ACTN|nr:hypothetical protein SAMN05421869_15826 [Nonomuraea jiangxiensis]
MRSQNVAMLAGGALLLCAVHGGVNAHAETLAPPGATLKHGDSALMRYVDTPEQRRKATSARARLVKGCMKEFGFSEFSTQEASGNPPPLLSSRRYLYVSPADAARFGYGIDPATAKDFDKPKDAVRAAVPSEEQSVLLGQGLTSYKGKTVAPGGCVRQADGILRKNTPAADLLLPWKLMNQAAGMAAKDERVTSLVAAWASCIRGRGYAYQAPEQAWDDPRWRPARTAAGVSEEEKKAAVADMECKDQVGYVDKLASVQNSYEKDLIRAHVDELEAIQRNQEAFQRNADIVMSGGRP